MTNGIEFQVPIQSLQRQLFENKYGKLLGSISGEINVRIDKLPDKKSEDEFGEELGAAFISYFFTSSKRVTRKGIELQINAGTDWVYIRFTSKDLLSIHVSVPIAIVKLDFEELSISNPPKGYIEPSITLEVFFVPNYRLLAKQGTRQAIQSAIEGAANRTSSIIRTVSKKAGTKVRVVVRYGIDAINKPLLKLLDRFALKLARKALKMGSQTKALGRILAGYSKWIGRAAGIAGIYLDAYLITQEALPGVISDRSKKTFSFLASSHRDGYCWLLSVMTDVTTKSIQKEYYKRGLRLRLLSDPYPNLFAVYQVLATTGSLKKPNIHAGDWAKKIANNGPKFNTVVVEPLLQIVPEELLNEAFASYFLFCDYNKASGENLRINGQKMVEHAVHLARSAGIAAAYHDILAFVLMTGLYQDKEGNVDSSTAWDEWNNVSFLHRVLYGDDHRDRFNLYMNMSIEAKTFKPHVLPFLMPDNAI